MLAFPEFGVVCVHVSKRGRKRNCVFGQTENPHWFDCSTVQYCNVLITDYSTVLHGAWARDYTTQLTKNVTTVGTASSSLHTNQSRKTDYFVKAITDLTSALVVSNSVWTLRALFDR